MTTNILKSSYKRTSKKEEVLNSSSGFHIKMGECKAIPANGNYGDIQKFPMLLASFLSKYVRIRTLKSITHTGFIHSIDPATYSIILTTDGKNQIILIPGHAIVDIEEISNESNINLPQRLTEVDVTAEEISIKKHKLIGWLKHNMLPVTEDEDKIVFNNIKVLPPYSSIDISTYNPNIALQIKKLIEKMPNDFVPT